MNLGKGVRVRTFSFRLCGRAVAMWSLSTLGQMAAPTNPPVIIVINHQNQPNLLFVLIHTNKQTTIFCC